jgi:TatD DNase family protein
MLNLIDSHTHAEFFFKQGSENAMRQRALDAGIVHALNVGTGLQDWQLYANAAREHPQFYSYSVGIHPCHVEAGWEAELAAMTGFLQQPVAPVAWGEMGLDYFHLPKDPEEVKTAVEMQHQAFISQLELVRKYPLPVIIHSRHAFDDTVALIDQSGIPWTQFIFHCFTYGVKEMSVLLERGGRASFTGIITYSKTEEIHDALRLQGLDKLMLETDAPWLSPLPVRKEKNEPAYLTHVAEKAAQILGVSVEEVAERTTLNARSFFRLP